MTDDLHVTDPKWQKLRTSDVYQIEKLKKKKHKLKSNCEPEYCSILFCLSTQPPLIINYTAIFLLYGPSPKIDYKHATGMLVNGNPPLKFPIFILTGVLGNIP